MRKLIPAIALAAISAAAQAQNPVIKTMFTPDPAPYVHGDTCYLFVDHDEDDALYFKMKDWLLYSTTDMVNWTFRGVPVNLGTFSWAKQGDRAWACQAVEKGGKWYWYVCCNTADGKDALAVAVADRPDGPYRDAIGAPLATGCSFIDPSVFIDDDGRAYLVWGNKGCWYGELNPDMVSFRNGYQEIPGFHDPKCFGPEVTKKNWCKGGVDELMTGYEEGPWLMKRGSTYYLSYPAGGVPEHMAYSTASNINGPWTYQGRIMDEAQNSFTIHGGNVEYKGHSYMFYHNGMAPNGGGFRRSTCVEEFKWTPDGKIPFIPFTSEGVSPVGTINPYNRVEAETMADSYGLKTDRSAGHEHYVTNINNGDWLCVRAVDFGAGISNADKITARFLNVRARDARVEFHLDRLDGQLFASIQAGSGNFQYSSLSDKDTKLQNAKAVISDIMKEVSGTHDVYILFRGDDGELMDFDCWQIKKDQKVSYRNPIINADAPDMDVVRAGDYYYMVSTTMHLMPGGPIMRSKDMIKWETVSYLFDSITDGDRYYLRDNKTCYGQGQWASSLRYHNGKFYCWFTANGAPGKGFIFCADKAEGPWKVIARPPHMHDGSLFFDDNGKAYIFHGGGTCTMTELTPDLQGIQEGGVNKIVVPRDPDEPQLLEGSHVYKHNGKYYISMISMAWGIPGRVRRQVCYRADNIEGPYTEKKIILETPFESYGGVGQGAIVDGPDGQWYALIFQDRGGIGRVPCLMPCTWSEDGWPILGDKDGKIPNDLSKHHEDLSGIIGSDEFASDKLSLYWQFNHNPVTSCYSLSARKGYMRLTTPRVAGNIFVAPNTMTQRMYGPTSTGTVQLEFSKMKDGDRCGLAALNGLSGNLSVCRDGGKYFLVLTQEDSKLDDSKTVIGNDITELYRVELKTRKIQLRVAADFNPGVDMATFSYSIDGGKSFVTIGKKVPLQFDYRRMFMGSKFAIFNYATKTPGGYVDVDWFHVTD